MAKFCLKQATVRYRRTIPNPPQKSRKKLQIGMTKTTKSWVSARSPAKSPHVRSRYSHQCVLIHADLVDPENV